MQDSKLINLKDVKIEEPKSKKTKHEKSSKTEKKEPWESGIKVLDSVDVVIPAKLLFICDAISKKVFSDEFSIVTQIKEKDNNTIYLSDEYYIPKQKVAMTSIEYLPDHYSFNTVIHRHPDGMNTFSSTDRSFINQNFELSILYTREDGFVNGVFNLKHEDYLIQIPVIIYIDYGLEDIDITNIERETLISSYSREKESLKSGKWDTDKTQTDDRDLLLAADNQKLFPEESLDYNMMKNFLLDDVSAEIENLDYRVTNIEDTMMSGGLDELPF